jgi:hypothetical protein
MISPVAQRERERERERDCDQDREIEDHEKWDPFVGLYFSEVESEYSNRWRE